MADRAGQPLASAEVRLSSTVPIGGLLVSMFTSTDASGRFSFANVTAGPYELIARASIDGDVAGMQVTVPASGNAALLMRLARPGAFRGTVLRSGATDHSGTFVTCLFDLATSEVDGRFELGGIPAGSWRVSAELAHAWSETTVTMPHAGDTVSVPPLTLSAGPAPSRR